MSIINLVLQRMAQGYREQLPLYEKMHLIALDQEKILNNDEINIEEIIKNINSRQELIIVLDNLTNDLSRLKDEICKAVNIEEFNISAIRVMIPGSGVDELDKGLEEIALLLRKIKDLDKKNEETLRLRINETKDKLSKIQGTKKADKAYNPLPSNKEGVFIDYSK